MEVEAPEILEAALAAAVPDNLYDAIRSIVEPVGRRRGRPINRFDARIAAIARACSVSLATPDTRDVAETGAQADGPWRL